VAFEGQRRIAPDEAEYPGELDDCVTLANRSRIRIRALRRGEEDVIRELDQHLSVRTRYLRFFSPMPALPDAVMRLLVDVDYCRRLALVALHDDDDNGREVLGLGSYGAVDDRSAEVALVVRDAWQQQGVGTELARRVLQAAEDRGFHRFITHVLADNAAIRRLLKRVGDLVSTTAIGREYELAFVRRRPPAGPGQFSAAPCRSSRPPRSFPRNCR
jgi:acetyltransferase